MATSLCSRFATFKSSPSHLHINNGPDGVAPIDVYEVIVSPAARTKGGGKQARGLFGTNWCEGARRQTPCRTTGRRACLRAVLPAHDQTWLRPAGQHAHPRPRTLDNVKVRGVFGSVDAAKHARGQERSQRRCRQTNKRYLLRVPRPQALPSLSSAGVRFPGPLAAHFLHVPHSQFSLLTLKMVAKESSAKPSINGRLGKQRFCM